MKLSLHHKSINNLKIKNNLKKNKFFINEFERNSFLSPILNNNYFKQYNLAKKVSKKNIVHVFGMGGSSLSSKMLLQFINPKELNKRFFIYDNPYDEIIIKNLNHHKITNVDKFIFISKSGKTVEIKYFLEYLLNFLKTNKIKNYFKNFIFVTEDNDNYLKNFAKKNNITCFDHDPNIGGRFSLFSITGLLPLALLGYPYKNLINDSKKSFIEFKRTIEKNTSHLIDFYLSQKEIKSNIIVGFTYDQKLTSFNEWYRQIFAESLGKNMKSQTYITSLGPIDQHSQFQLYIDGAKDKSYIFFKLINKTNQKSLLSILQNGAIKTLKQNNNLISEISINDDFKDFSKLIFILIYDIFIRSKIEKINFLDQPAVEKLKNNTKV